MKPMNREYQILVSAKVRIGGLSNSIHKLVTKYPKIIVAILCKTSAMCVPLSNFLKYINIDETMKSAKVM